MNKLSDSIQSLIDSFKNEEFEFFNKISDIYKELYPTELNYSEIYGIKNGVLIIKVYNATAISLLQFKKEQIKDNINKKMKMNVIKDIKYSLKTN